MSPNAMTAQQRAVQAKQKLKEDSERLKKENPVLAKMKEKQEAALKARLSGEGKKGNKSDRGSKTDRDDPKKKGKGKDGDKKDEGSGEADEADEAAKEEEKAKKDEAEAKKKEEAKKKKKREKEEVRELPPDQNPVDAEWTAASWLKTLDLQTVISAALKPPEGDGNGAAFTYVKNLQRDQVEKMLNDANLGGLVRTPLNLCACWLVGGERTGEGVTVGGCMGEGWVAREG